VGQTCVCRVRHFYGWGLCEVVLTASQPLLLPRRGRLPDFGECLVTHQHFWFPYADLTGSIACGDQPTTVLSAIGRTTQNLCFRPQACSFAQFFPLAAVRLFKR
jgi:hypothetical protein